MELPRYLLPVSILIDVVRAEKELFEILSCGVRPEPIKHLV
jgi:hypothetical protein